MSVEQVNRSIKRMKTDDALQAKIMEVEDTAEEIDSVLAEVSDEVLEGIVAGNIPKPPPYGFDGG